MKYLQYIIYGVIVGQWLMNVKRRLTPTDGSRGRYVIVAMHAHKEEYVLVGRSADKCKALGATDFVEENAMCYFGLCYDLLDPDDRAEFESKLFCPYIDDEDRSVIEDARGML